MCTMGLLSKGQPLVFLMKRSGRLLILYFSEFALLFRNDLGISLDIPKTFLFFQPK